MFSGTSMNKEDDDYNTIRRWTGKWPQIRWFDMECPILSANVGFYPGSSNLLIYNLLFFNNTVICLEYPISNKNAKEHQFFQTSAVTSALTGWVVAARHRCLRWRRWRSAAEWWAGSGAWSRWSRPAAGQTAGSPSSSGCACPARSPPLKHQRSSVERNATRPNETSVERSVNQSGHSSSFKTKLIICIW